MNFGDIGSQCFTDARPRNMRDIRGTARELMHDLYQTQGSMLGPLGYGPTMLLRRHSNFLKNLRKDDCDIRLTLAPTKQAMLGSAASVEYWRRKTDGSVFKSSATTQTLY